MTRSCLTRRAVAAALWTAASAGAYAAVPIDLEVATDVNAPPGSMQEWGRVLGEMDLVRLRLRGARAGDEPAVEATGEGAGKRYVVVAILNRQNELVLPGGKFRQHQRAALKTFLDELPHRVDEAGIERGPFGLPLPQLEELIEDLSSAVEQSTKGQRPEAVVATITRQIKTSVDIDSTARSTLARSKPLTVELKGISAGAALAAALRSASLAALPEEAGDNRVTFRVVPVAADQSAWPVGWKPAKSPKVLAPAMYEFTTVEIENYTLAKALEALTPHLGVPLVIDERTLAARRLDPAKTIVKFPAGKTYIRRAVDRILAQGRLAGEMRVDEAGRPFYWVTQYGPESPHAPEAPREPSRD